MWEKFSNFFETLNDKTVGWSSQCSSNLAYYIEEWHIFYFLPPCLIVFDFMVYHGPNFLISKTKNASFFSEVRGKAFARNSLIWKFLLDVWFGLDCVYSNIEHLSNIDEIYETPYGYWGMESSFKSQELDPAPVTKTV